MKICHFEYKNQKMFGVIKEGLVFPFDSPENLFEMNDKTEFSQPFDSRYLKFFLPVTPSKIVCVGRNYTEHAKELGNEVPREPLLFLKAASSLILSGENIIIPKQSNQVEHEGELGIVINKTCKNLSEIDNAFNYVFGYLCLNDVTARDLQRRDVQFTRAKSFDTFCPISHFIETDLDVSDISVVTRVNGEIKQAGRTSQMVFSVPFLIKYISNQMTLKAGDIIATGTPAGVSNLISGDVCEVEIEGIGILSNPVE